MVLDESILTVRECATYLRVDETTVRRWIEQGTLSAILLPNAGKKRVYRIHRHVIDAMLNGVGPGSEQRGDR